MCCCSDYMYIYACKFYWVWLLTLIIIKYSRIGFSEFLPINSIIHSGHFYSASSRSLQLRSAPDTARILCRSFTPKRHMELRVKNWPKVHTRRLERDSNPRPSGRKVLTLATHDQHACYTHKSLITRG